MIYELSDGMLGENMTEYNQIPSQCRALCPLEQDYVDTHGIVLSLNCKGATLASETLKSRIQVDTGSVVAVEEGPIDAKDNLGKYACQNAGFNLWLDQKTEDFQDTQS